MADQAASCVAAAFLLPNVTRIIAACRKTLVDGFCGKVSIVGRQWLIRKRAKVDERQQALVSNGRNYRIGCALSLCALTVR
jgi:hypothetical protein